MYTITLTLPPFVNRGNVAKKILTRFAAEAGLVIVEGIQSVLGTDAIYTLSPGYAKQKPRLREYRRTAGKPLSQPLILTGEMWDALGFHLDGNCITVQVEDGKAVSGGEDYAEMWEEKTQYLEKGFAVVESRVLEILTTICCEVMEFTP